MEGNITPVDNTAGSHSRSTIYSYSNLLLSGGFYVFFRIGTSGFTAIWSLSLNFLTSLILAFMDLASEGRRWSSSIVPRCVDMSSSFLLTLSAGGSSMTICFGIYAGDCSWVILSTCMCSMWMLAGAVVGVLPIVNYI